MFEFLRKTKAESEVAEQKSSSATSQLASPTSDFFGLFGVTPSTSGATVSPITAMNVPAVRAAVQAVSEALGQIEGHLYTVGENARKATDHPVYALLHDAVNPWTSASRFRELLTRDALLYGNGYGSIVRDADGAPAELFRLRPDAVSVLFDINTLEPIYNYSPVNGDLVTYSYRDVIHLDAASLDGYRGESAVIQGREAIGLSITLEQFAGRLFANGARPSGVLRVPGKLLADAVTRLRASWQAAFGGTNSGGTMILEEGMVFDQLALSSVDAQFLQMREHQIKEIARIFRVNPILLGEMERASFANSAEMGRQFITYTLLPWVRRWEGEVTLKLLTPQERGSYRIELDTDDFDRADIAARMTAYSSAIASRVLNPNECREYESKPPYDGGNDFINPNIVTETARVG